MSLECDKSGIVVDPIMFYDIPLKPQIQRLISGKVDVYKGPVIIYGRGGGEFFLF
jgi:hypothetical protein